MRKNSGKNRLFWKTLIFFVIVALCPGLLFSAASSGASKKVKGVETRAKESGGSSKILRKSGSHRLNVHSAIKGDSREVVRGQITKVTSSEIVMDGESFPLTGLQDRYGAGLSHTDIYPGLAADVVYYGGGVEKIIISDLKRPMVITDRKFIDQERSKTVKGR